MKAEIIAVGTELLLGQIVDTNSAYIAQQLTTVGVDVHFKATVGDNLERIKETIKNSLGRSDIVITTGGIGPTLDDLTREAVAAVLGRKLVFQPRLFEQISDFFARLGRPVGENNRKQAFIPEGAIPIENPVGTAPGFIAEEGGKAVISIPGVPHEMRYFMEHSVLPYLRGRLGIKEIIVSRVLKLFGIGESLVDERLKDLIEEGSNPTIGLLAHTQIGEIHVRLTAKAAEQQKAASLNAALEEKIRQRLGEFIFGADDETFEEVIAKRLHQAGLKVAVAETTFGSSIIQTLKLMGRSDEFFAFGVTVTSPEAAQRILGVEPSLWEKGQANLELAKALAQGVRRLTASDVGLAVTGKTGAEKGQDHIACVALAYEEGVEGLEQRWPSALRYIENRVTKMALSQLDKYLSRLQAP